MLGWLFGKSKKPKQAMSVTGDGVSQTTEELIPSSHSGFPRYYVINGKKYDIDNIHDVRRMPVFGTVIYIDGKPYGMDTILLEHYRKCNDDALGYAAYEKSQEFRKHGFIRKSSWEIELENRARLRVEKEKTRKKQCDSFSVDDMQQFPDLPFAFGFVMNLRHTDGIAWFQLNKNNQEIVKNYISIINDIIVDAKEYVGGIGNVFIDLENLDFDYPQPMRKNSMCCTRVECFPYTPTGKLSKYPAVIQFATKADPSGLRTIGEIKLLRDGSIGAATVSTLGNTFKIGLHGSSLVLKSIYNPYLGGNLFRFQEAQI